LIMIKQIFSGEIVSVSASSAGISRRIDLVLMSSRRLTNDGHDCGIRNRGSPVISGPVKAAASLLRPPHRCP
jgi:hypothetical protein